MVLGVKNVPANAPDIRDAGSIPGSGRSPGGEHVHIFNTYTLIYLFQGDF